MGIERKDFSMTKGEKVFYRFVAAPAIRAFLGLGRLSGLIKIDCIYNEDNFKCTIPLALYRKELRCQIRDLLEQGKVFIIASNHENRLHTIIAAWVVNRLGLFSRKMVKDKYYKNKFLARLLFAVGCFPVDLKKTITGLRYGQKILENDENLLIFPEGTRGGEEIYPGIGFISYLTRGKSQLLPIKIKNKGFITEISIGRIFNTSSFSPERKTHQEEVVKLLVDFYGKRQTNERSD